MQSVYSKFQKKTFIDCYNIFVHKDVLIVLMIFNNTIIGSSLVQCNQFISSFKPRISTGKKYIKFVPYKHAMITEMIVFNRVFKVATWLY